MLRKRKEGEITKEKEDQRDGDGRREESSVVWKVAVKRGKNTDGIVRTGPEVVDRSLFKVLKDLLERWLIKESEQSTVFIGNEIGDRHDAWEVFDRVVVLKQKVYKDGNQKRHEIKERLGSICWFFFVITITSFCA